MKKEPIGVSRAALIKELQIIPLVDGFELTTLILLAEKNKSQQRTQHRQPWKAENRNLLFVRYGGKL